MYSRLSVGTISIPTYGTVILLGIIICLNIAKYVIKKNNLCILDFLKILIAGGSGAVIGAKSLHIVLEFIKGREICLLSNLSSQTGYAYYGGLLGFLLCALLMCKIAHIDGLLYSRKLIFLLPLLHAFWKMGCFFAGCCIGIIYEGPFYVCFPEGVNSVAGKGVFPVQILEAIISVILSIFIYTCMRSKENIHPLGAYLLGYGFSRFFIEFLRFHQYGYLVSIHHLFSIVSVIIGWRLIRRHKEKVNE